MKLLVAGASEVDAGKTTFTTGLIERTGVRGYKPRAGNDYWYDQDDYRDAVDRGRLYGKDAKRLAAAAPGDVRPEAINPIHRLWLPTPRKGKGLLGREGRAFVVDRVTRPDDDGGNNARNRDGADEYVVNGTVTVPPAAERAFPLDSAPTVESLPALNDLMAERHRPALTALGEDIAAREDAIVESYSDIARPLAGFVPDAVAVVEPRRCRIYDGDRYAKACEVASGSAHEGRLEERVDHVIELLDPVASVTLPALSSEERADLPVVADAYSEAYDALLAAV
ncbi:MAG: putative P-loop ATPase/GTPase [Natronomonas sp.]|jgi:predicted P-loop ATPase/GTPase